MYGIKKDIMDDCLYVFDSFLMKSFIPINYFYYCTIIKCVVWMLHTNVVYNEYNINLHWSVAEFHSHHIAVSIFDLSRQVHQFHWISNCYHIVANTQRMALCEWIKDAGDRLLGTWSICPFYSVQSVAGQTLLYHTWLE